MKEIASLLAQNHILAASVILFGIGFVNLLLQKNLIRKIIGLNIMDTAIFLLLTSFGYIEGRYAPILVSTTDPAQVEQYVNPIPTGLVRTGIVVSVSCTAFMLALTQRLYLRYHTLDIDAILMMVRKGGN